MVITEKRLETGNFETQCWREKLFYINLTTTVRLNNSVSSPETKVRGQTKMKTVAMTGSASAWSAVLMMRKDLAAFQERLRTEVMTEKIWAFVYWPVLKIITSYKKRLKPSF